MERSLLSLPQSITRVEDDNLVCESLRQSSQILVDASKDWELRLRKAASLKSGLKGLLPWNRSKADELIVSVRRDLEHPEVLEAAKTFDEERLTLRDWF